MGARWPGPHIDAVGLEADETRHRQAALLPVTACRRPWPRLGQHEQEIAMMRRTQTLCLMAGIW